MQLQVTHETRYDYEPAVETAQHMAYLKPRDTSHQHLTGHALHITPTPSQISTTMDVFGNSRCYFSLQVPHTSLTVVAQSVLTTTSQPLPKSSISWEQVRERFRYQAGAKFDDAAEFVFASPYVPRHPEFIAYARPSFAPGTPVLAAAQNLMQRIHADFTYESLSTEVNTPALQALAQRKGVCQDFAHIMIACLRSMGIPARYVSGYLLTHAAPGTVKLVGSDASHAWVAVYVPDIPGQSRWCDLDPTNDRCGWHSPGEDYVTLAVGRDFSDVSHTLSVAVTVEPAPRELRPDVATRLPASQKQEQSGLQGQTQNQ
jgi:transglutaminase-like putative cysteine protease